MLSINRQLFKQNGVRVEPFEHPSDWFRTGFALQEKSGGRITGFNYCGFHFHGEFYGNRFREQNDGRWLLDRSRMARLLEDIKPCLHHKQLSIKWDMSQFFDNTLAICCHYLHALPWIVKLMNKTTDMVRLPFEPGGFAPESGFMGGVPASSDCAEEATLLLGFIASEKGQTALVEKNPEWLSVHKAVLSRQKDTSPYPEGSVIYEYTPRKAIREGRIDSFELVLPRMETEAAKFYLGMQGIKETLDKMENAGRSPGSVIRRQTTEGRGR